MNGQQQGRYGIDGVPRHKRGHLQRVPTQSAPPEPPPGRRLGSLGLVASTSNARSKALGFSSSHKAASAPRSHPRRVHGCHARPAPFRPVDSSTRYQAVACTPHRRVRRPLLRSQASFCLFRSCFLTKLAVPPSSSSFHHCIASYCCPLRAPSSSIDPRKHVEYANAGAFAASENPQSRGRHS